MTFKRHWGKLRSNKITAIGAFSFFFLLMLFMIYRDEYFTAAMCLVVIPAVLFQTLVYGLMFHGFFTDQICIDEQGITLITEKRGTKVFRWEEIRTIRDAERDRMEALVVWDGHDNMIWFYSNNEIKEYMKTVHRGFLSIYDSAHPVKPGEVQLL